MDTTAIRQAIRFYHEPAGMAGSLASYTPLPNGMTDLLRLCASQKLLDSFSRDQDIDAGLLKTILLNFIEKVLLEDGNTPHRILGALKSSNPGTLRLHYQLLMKIFHPDRNLSKEAQINAGKINAAYDSVRQSLHDNTLNTIEISQFRQPKSFYHATALTRKQLNQTRNGLLLFALLSLVTIFGLVAYHEHDDSTSLIVRNTSQTQTGLITEKKTDNPEIIASARLPMRSNTVNKAPVEIAEARINLASFGKSLDKAVNDASMQLLLAELENAYETGNVQKIKAIIANEPEIRNQSDSQLRSKLETLFSITENRKMVLYDFNWQQLNGRVVGKGRFLSRYILSGEAVWLTRTGDAIVTAEINNNHQVVITGLEMNDRPDSN